MGILDAGRQLDALVAEKVLKFKLDYEFADIYNGPLVPGLRDQYDEMGILPHYSTDIAAAWEVVERMRSGGWRLELRDWVTYWSARFNSDPDSQGRFAKEEDVPHAICLAALKAVGVEL